MTLAPYLERVNRDEASSMILRSGDQDEKKFIAGLIRKAIKKLVVEALSRCNVHLYDVLHHGASTRLLKGKPQAVLRCAGSIY